MKESKKWSLNVLDWKSISMGLLKTSIGACLTYLSKDVLPNIDWGTYGPVAVPVYTMVVNIIWKWVQGK